MPPFGSRHRIPEAPRESVGQYRSGHVVQTHRSKSRTRVFLFQLLSVDRGNLSKGQAGFGNQRRVVLLDGPPAEFGKQLNRGTPGSIERNRSIADLKTRPPSGQMVLALPKLRLHHRCPGIRPFLCIEPDVVCDDAVRSRAPLLHREGLNVIARPMSVGGGAPTDCAASTTPTPHVRRLAPRHCRLAAPSSVRSRLG